MNHPFDARPAAVMHRCSLIGVRSLIVLVFLGVSALLGWAAIGRLQESAHAPGQVISVARTQTVQAIDGGVLEALPVREGQRVSRGELLAQLERTRAQAARDETLGKVMALRATLVRLRAEVFDRPLEFGTEFAQWPQFVSNQRALFERRRRALHDSLASLQAVQANVDAELRITEPLEVNGDVGRAEVLRLKRQQAELMGQMVNLRNKYFQDAQAEMTRAAEELASQERVLQERSTLLEHTELRAPSDGLVKKILVTTIGAALRPGETVLELVPVGSELVVEAKLQPSDLAFVHPGLPAAVKFDAYDSSIFGQADGEVSYVSPDALSESDPRLGERPYYRMHVRITRLPERLVRGRAMVVQPGMTVQVEVRTGERTVLQYLAKPIAKTFSESLHER